MIAKQNVDWVWNYILNVQDGSRRHSTFRSNTPYIPLQSNQIYNMYKYNDLVFASFVHLTVTFHIRHRDKNDDKSTKNTDNIEKSNFDRCIKPDHTHSVV